MSDQTGCMSGQTLSWPDIWQAYRKKLFAGLQMHIFFAEFIIAFFCPTSWVILKQLDSSPSRATDQ